MKFSKTAQLFLLKDGEISIGTIVKLIACVAFVALTYTGGYIIGDLRELQTQMQVKYIHQICIEKRDYLKCYDHILEALKKPSLYPSL
jgi:hypothetical protein